MEDDVAPEDFNEINDPLVMSDEEKKERDVIEQELKYAVDEADALAEEFEELRSRMESNDDRLHGAVNGVNDWAGRMRGRINSDLEEQQTSGPTGHDHPRAHELHDFAEQFPDMPDFEWGAPTPLSDRGIDRDYVGRYPEAAGERFRSVEDDQIASEPHDFC